MSNHQKISLLLAEADPIALEMCSTIIKRRYPQLVVHAVSSADEGIALFKQYKHDIVISDIFFPHSSGMILAQEACAEKPDAWVMFITGDHSINKLLADDNAGKLCLHRIVNKPLDVAELLLSIASAITTISEGRKQH
jgi:DNA-binding NarL/FixJ family response regulator